MSKEITNPHDKYFAAALSFDVIAKGFLKLFLPPRQAGTLDIDNSLQLVSNSYIDKQLHGHFTDVVFRCRLKDSDEEVTIGILIEHKSYPDEQVVFQVLRYVQNIWDTDTREGHKRQLVIPLVLYHGQEKWSQKAILDFFPTQIEHLKQYLPIFDYLLVDLSEYSQSQISSLKVKAMVRSFLMALRFGRDKEFMSTHADLIFYRSDEYYHLETGKNFLQTTFVYLLNVTPIPEKNWENIIENLPKPIKKTAMTLYDSILLKGIEKGIEKGEAKGKTKGIQTVLVVGKKLRIGTKPDVIATELEIDIKLVLKIKEELGF